MLNLCKFSHRSGLGIDISPTAINVVEFSKKKKIYSILAYASEPLPENAIVPQEIQNRELVIACMQKLFSQTHFIAKKAILAIPDAVIFKKEIQLDAALSAQEIEEAVFIELDQNLSYRLEDIHADFVILNPAKKTASLDVLIMATHKENIQSRIAIAQRLNLEVCIVDVESNAIERMNLFFSQFPDYLNPEIKRIFNANPGLFLAGGLALRNVH